MVNGKKQSTRAFLSIGSALAFIILVVSGAALYTAPPCSVADSTGWSFMLIGKHGWEAVHISFALAFILLGSLHLWYNWGPFAGYFARKPGDGNGAPRSLIIAAVAAAAILVMSILDIPPVSWLHDAHERIKFSWSRGDGPGRGEGRGMRGFRHEGRGRHHQAR